MKIRTVSSCILLFLCVFAPLFANEKPVISAWVPPYGIRECKANLQDSTIKAGEVLDRMGMLFWEASCTFTETDTTITGKLDFIYPTIDSSEVVWFRDWAREHNVEALLCIGFVMVPDEDYILENLDLNSKLQKIAFHDNQDTLIRSLIDEMDKYDLDGIGLDFEHLVGYRTEYAGFVQRIAASVHSRGKILNVCVMPSTQWMGVNTTWWEDYVGYADELLIMGYNETYAGQDFNHGGNVTNNYQSILDYGLSLGYKPTQLAFGMPAWMNDWGKGGRGTSTLDHLFELRDLDTTISVALCDMRLVGNSWKDSLTWRTLQNINQPHKVILDEIDLSKKLTDEDSLTLSWTLPEETAHQAKVISVRAYDSTKYKNQVIDTSKWEWRVVDTIAAEVESYTLDLSSIEDTLFTVMVALVDESGAVIDYGLTGTYFELEQITGIVDFANTKVDGSSILSVQNKKISIHLKSAELCNLAIYSLSGRKVAHHSALLDAGTNHFALPQNLAAGTYMVQLKTDSFQKSQKFQMR